MADHGGLKGTTTTEYQHSARANPRHPVRHPRILRAGVPPALGKYCQGFLEGGQTDAGRGPTILHEYRHDSY